MLLLCVRQRLTDTLEEELVLCRKGPSRMSVHIHAMLTYVFQKAKSAATSDGINLKPLTDAHEKLIRVYLVR